MTWDDLPWRIDVERRGTEPEFGPGLGVFGRPPAARLDLVDCGPEGPCHEDHVELELVALARAGDEAGFRELAACVMPESEVSECWKGTRTRLGFPSPPPPCPVQRDSERFYSRPFLALMDDPQNNDPLV